MCVRNGPNTARYLDRSAFLGGCKDKMEGRLMEVALDPHWGKKQGIKEVKENR